MADTRMQDDHDANPRVFDFNAARRQLAELTEEHIAEEQRLSRKAAYLVAALRDPSPHAEREADDMLGHLEGLLEAAGYLDPYREPGGGLRV